MSLPTRGAEPEWIIFQNSRLQQLRIHIIKKVDRTIEISLLYIFIEA